MDLVDILKKEKKQNANKLKHIAKLNLIIAGFEKTSNYINRFGTSFFDYATSEFNIPQQYSANDITDFCIALQGYQRLKDYQNFSGLYLSALINKCSEKEIVIKTEHLLKPIDMLGYKLKDHIIFIEGNLGKEVGTYMQSGKILVKGNVLGVVGKKMVGGIITIFGDVDFSVGYLMDGGEIIIQGNAGRDAGLWMNNGIIRLEKDYKTIALHFNGGNVFYNNKQIIKDGKKQ